MTLEQALQAIRETGRLADIGQLSQPVRGALQARVNRGVLRKSREPWPGPHFGTCVKTFYFPAEATGDPAHPPAPPEDSE